MNFPSLLFASFVFIVGCSVEPDDPLVRHPLGKADLAGSCTLDSCDGPAERGNCWCDDACSDFGDCCSNYERICVAAPACEGPPIPCAPPPPDCHYEGLGCVNGNWTCGTLACS